MLVGEVRSWAMMELRFLMRGICVRAPAVVVRGWFGGSVVFLVGVGWRRAAGYGTPTAM